MKSVEKYGTPLVSNVLGSTGKPVPNQFIVAVNGCYLFQSYASRICLYDINENMVYIGVDWDRSPTTLKYLRQFMRTYCSRWYASIMSRGKRDFRANLQYCIANDVVTYVENW